MSRLIGRVTRRARCCSDDGTAMVEFIWLAILLMIPLVYVVLTAPVDAGSGPLQAVSDTVRTTLPQQAVPVR